MNSELTLSNNIEKKIIVECNTATTIKNTFFHIDNSCILSMPKKIYRTYFKSIKEFLCISQGKTFQQVPLTKKIPIEVFLSSVRISFTGTQNERYNQ